MAIFAPPLPGVVVVVTGASSGIGRAAAERFARAGADLVLVARRPDALEEVAAACRSAGAATETVVTDVSDAQAVQRVAERAVARFGQIDVWVNNAGVLLIGDLEETPLDAYRRVIDVNLFGQVHGARAALAQFRKKGRGTLINVASVAGQLSVSYANAYAASKHAVIGMSNALRQELASEKDIHVCTVSPAGVDTPILAHAANFTGKNIEPVFPLVSPEKVARVIVRLARRPRRDVVIGRSGWFQTRLARTFPAAHEKVVATLFDKALERADPEAPSAGNLYEPGRSHAVEGGLRGPARRVLKGVAVAGLIGWAGSAVARKRR